MHTSALIKVELNRFKSSVCRFLFFLFHITSVKAFLSSNKEYLINTRFCKKPKIVRVHALNTLQVTGIFPFILNPYHANAEKMVSS